jgi:hypothetical protein
MVENSMGKRVIPPEFGRFTDPLLNRGNFSDQGIVD